VHGDRPDPALLDQLTPQGEHTVLHLADGARIHAGDRPAGPTLTVETEARGGADVEGVASATPVSATVRRSVLTVADVAAAGLVLVVVLAIVQARRLTRPIDELARAAQPLGGGDFSARPHRSVVLEPDAWPRRSTPAVSGSPRWSRPSGSSPAMPATSSARRSPV
jgi:HAMP domain-containing protein